MTRRRFALGSDARAIVREGIVLGVVLTLVLSITATLALAAVDR